MSGDRGAAGLSSSWSQQYGGQQQQEQSSEAKRRLGASLAMPPPSQPATLNRKASQARLQQQQTADLTVAVYTFSHEKGEPMPYRIKIPSKNVTLRHVKDFLPKKGAFRYNLTNSIMDIGL